MQKSAENRASEDPTSDSLLDEKQSRDEGREVKVKDIKSPPERWRLKLLALFMSFVSLGLSASMNGPTLVDLEQVLHTDTKGMSIPLSLHGAGYLVGAVLCGLTFDRLHMELQLSTMVSLLGVLTVAAPWTASLAAYSLLFCLRAVCMGFLNSAGQAYALHVMHGHRLQAPAIQSIHILVSLGATVGPLIVQPFLSPRAIDKQTLNVSSNMSVYHNESTSGDEISLYSNKGNITSVLPPTRVQFSFLVIGLICIGLSSLFWFVLLTGPAKCLRAKKKEGQTDSIRNQKDPRTFRIALLLILYMWFFSYVWVETIPSDFIATWAIKALKWPKYLGPILTSTLWAALGAGRLLAVPVSTVLPPRLMLYISCTATSLSFVVLLAFHRYHQAVIWASVSTAALGMSWAFGSTVLWASRQIHVDGAASSIFLIGLSSAKIVAPLITGYLFQEYSPMWFLYVITAAAFLNYSIFVSLEIFAKCYKMDKTRKDNKKEDRDV